MRVEFGIQAWAALAPGLSTAAHWLDWAAQPALPAGKTVVELAHIPAMSRRRLGHLAKMAVSVADDAANAAACDNIPVVWASRFGDAEKSLALLSAHALNEPLSPTHFGLSVHNGIGAQHSILCGTRANAVCIAASHGAAEAACVEACALLSEGVPQVLVVCYDEPLPAEYAGFSDEPLSEFAWAAVLVPADAQSTWFSLSVEAICCDVKVALAPAQQLDALPGALSAFQFLLHSQQGGARTRTWSDGQRQWRWELAGA